MRVQTFDGRYLAFNMLHSRTRNQCSLLAYFSSRNSLIQENSRSTNTLLGTKVDRNKLVGIWGLRGRKDFRELVSGRCVTDYIDAVSRKCGWVEVKN